MSEPIVEVRDYTIESEWWEQYQEWATSHAVPWLKANLDLVDFWMDDGVEAEVAGSSPVVSPNGQPNVCWVIRWPDRSAREEGWTALRADEGWQEVWAKHPNPQSYLQTNVRFMRAAASPS